MVSSYSCSQQLFGHVTNASGHISAICRSKSAKGIQMWHKAHFSMRSGHVPWWTSCSFRLKRGCDALKAHETAISGQLWWSNVENSPCHKHPSFGHLILALEMARRAMWDGRTMSETGWLHSGQVVLICKWASKHAWQKTCSHSPVGIHASRGTLRQMEHRKRSFTNLDSPTNRSGLYPWRGSILEFNEWCSLAESIGLGIPRGTGFIFRSRSQ